MSPDRMLGLTLLLLTPVSAATPVPLPPLVSPATSAATCGACHAEALASWRRSGHARAWTSPHIAASWARTQGGWCLPCHLPLVEQRAAVRADGTDPAAALRDEGVTCAACHVREGAILTAHAPTAVGLREHALTQDAAALSSATACARCHQFPARQPDGSAAPFAMQDTFEEWRGSAAAAAGVSCAGCHMDGDGHAMSARAGGLAAALDVSVRHVAATRIEAVVRADGVAHRVPTGDPFRRLVLRICTDDACARPIASALLSRSFETGPGGRLVAMHDTTVPPTTRAGETPERRLTLAIPPRDASGQPLHWELVHLAAESGLAALRPPERLASGRVP